MSMHSFQIMITLTCILSSTISAAQDPSLLAQWAFNEGQGEVARDSSGNGHDALIHGAEWVRHGDGFAISLDGFNDYIDCGQSARIGIEGRVTLEAWIARRLKSTTTWTASTP